MSRWLWVLSLLLIFGCKVERLAKPPQREPDQDLTIPNDSVPEAVAGQPVQRLKPPPSRSDTVRRKIVDTTATTYRFLTVDSITTISVKLDSTKPVTPLPVVTKYFPYGIFNLPPDSLCSQGMRYNLTAFPIIPSSVMGDLARVKKCGGQAIVQYPRRIMRRGINEDVYKVWEWMRDSVPDICPFVQDSTLLGLWVGDDISKKTEWLRGTYKEQLARWDSLGLMGLKKCPGILPILRARASQMGDRPNEGLPDSTKWRWVRASWWQYAGWKVAGDIRIAVFREDSLAKRLGLANLHGLNLLSGGCGPDPAGCPTLDGVKMKGINISGNQQGRWEMSADEYFRFGLYALKGSGCVMTGWAWGPKWGSSFHARADNKKVALELADSAQKKPIVPCKRR